MTGRSKAGPARTLDRDVLRTFAFAGLVCVVGSWIPLPGLQSETEPAWS